MGTESSKVPIEEQFGQYNEEVLDLLPEARRTHAAFRDRMGRTIMNGMRAKGYLSDGSFNTEGMVIETYTDWKDRPVVDIRDYQTHGLHHCRPEFVTCPRRKTKGQSDYEADMRGKGLSFPEPTSQQLASKVNDKETPMAEEKKARGIPAKSKNPAADGLCLCGCGTESVRRFKPGHDATLKSLFNRCLGLGKAGKTEATAEERARVKRAASFTELQESHYFGPLIEQFNEDKDGKKLAARRKAEAKEKEAAEKAKAAEEKAA